MDHEPPEFITTETPRRTWTLRRILLLLISILVLVAFLTYVLIVPFIAQDSAPTVPHVTPTVLPRF